MIQEEFSRLIFMYQEAAEGKGASVQEIFQKSLDFIELMKKELTTGDEEDQQAAVRMIKELYQHMRNHTKIMCDKAGITQEQFFANSENAANFSPDQWRKVQEAKQQLAKAGDDLVKLLQVQKAADPEGKAPSPESIMSKTASEKKDHKKKKAKKSQWMRS
jgi:hypothetical protein